MQQGLRQSTQECYKYFINTVDVIHHSGGSLGDDQLILQSEGEKTISGKQVRNDKRMIRS